MIDQTMLDSLPFGIIITDKSLNITACNRWITDRRPMEPVDLTRFQVTELFSEIKERGLQSIYELVLDSQQRITVSNRIHKFFLKMPGDPVSGLNYMPQSTIVAPLFDGNDLTGTITIISDVSERVTTERILNREIDKLSTLHSVDQALATLDLHACLDIIVTRTKAHFQAEGIVVFLDKEQQLNQAAGVGVPEVQTPPANSLAIWCFEQHKPEMIKYGQKALPFVPLIPDALTELAAPLMIGDLCIGVIQVSISQTHQFDRYDLELLEALATRAATAIQNARLHEDSEYWRKYNQRVNRRLQILLNAIDLMSKPYDLLQILNSVTELVAEVFQADYVYILKLDGTSNRLVPISTWGNNKIPLQMDDVDLPIARQIFSTGGKSKIYLNLNEITYLSEENRETLLSSGLCRSVSVGLSVRNNFAGIIQVFSSNPARDFNEDERELFEAMAAQLSLAIENAELFSQQQKLAVTDGLTGVYNRRWFDHELEIWVKRTQRTNHPMSLMIMDIDNFKHFNDTFGHQTGDDILKLLASMILKNVRDVDIVARYGGEEFVVILPDTALNEAVLVAERIRMVTMDLLKFAENPLVQGETLTISLGVATAPFHATDAQSILKIADQFLYKAKQTGKNRVVSS